MTFRVTPLLVVALIWPMRHSIERFYRCLEAKFASETARNVGAATYIVTLNRDGKYGMTKNVEEVRKIWRRLNEQPEPKNAISIIKTMNAVTAISDREH
jgi:hypothetical protein